MAAPSQGCGCNSVVECDLAKVDVEGSSPFTRSNSIPSYPSGFQEVASSVLKGKQALLSKGIPPRFYGVQGDFRWTFNRAYNPHLRRQRRSPRIKSSHPAKPARNFSGTPSHAIGGWLSAFSLAGDGSILGGICK